MSPDAQAIVEAIRHVGLGITLCLVGLVIAVLLNALMGRR